MAFPFLNINIFLAVHDHSTRQQVIQSQSDFSVRIAAFLVRYQLFDKTFSIVAVTNLDGQ